MCCKGMPKIIWAWFLLSGRLDIRLFQGDPEGFIQPCFCINAIVRIRKKESTFRHYYGNSGIILTKHFSNIICYHYNSALVRFAFYDVQSPFIQIGIFSKQLSGFGRPQTAAIQQLHKRRNDQMSYRIISFDGKMIQHMPYLENFCFSINMWYSSSTFFSQRSAEIRYASSPIQFRYRANSRIGNIRFLKVFLHSFSLRTAHARQISFVSTVSCG